MNLPTEAAFVSWLGAIEDLDGISIHGGADSQVVPGDATAVIASCEDADSPVSTLYLATVRIIVSTASLDPAAIDTHKTVSAALRGAVVTLTDIDEHFEDISFRGHKVQSVAEQREDNRWTTTFTLLVGISAD